MRVRYASCDVVPARDLDHGPGLDAGAHVLLGRARHQPEPVVLLRLLPQRHQVVDLVEIDLERRPHPLVDRDVPQRGDRLEERVVASVAAVDADDLEQVGIVASQQVTRRGREDLLDQSLRLTLGEHVHVEVRQPARPVDDVGDVVARHCAQSMVSHRHRQHDRHARAGGHGAAPLLEADRLVEVGQPVEDLVGLRLDADGDRVVVQVALPLLRRGARRLGDPLADAFEAVGIT